MEKLITMSDKDAVVQCDNEECSYMVQSGVSINPDNKEYLIRLKEYLNQPCPLCGENLLTEKDYNDSVALFGFIRWINKWFSWTTIFMRKQKRQTTSVHVHEGINIKKVDI